MKESSKKGLLAAITFHILVILLIVLFIYIPSCRPKEDHVFEIISPEDFIKQQSEKEEDPFSEELKSQFKTEESPKAQSLSYDDFIKKQGVPKVTGKVKQKKIKLGDLKLDDFAKDFHLKNSSEEATSNVTVAEINTYLCNLRGAIDKLWDKPEHLLNSNLFAVVEFSVDKRGVIIDARIVETSTDKLFDNSVLEAIRKLDDAGATPHGKDCTFKLTFRLEQKI